MKKANYNWKDSNLPLFSSDAQKKVESSNIFFNFNFFYLLFFSFVFELTEESAELEVAWTGVGKEPGLRIWRVEVCYYFCKLSNVY